LLPPPDRSVIVGAIDPIRRIDSPAGDAVNRPGYDGFLQTEHAKEKVWPDVSVYDA
jgi:hypothetical protein